MTKRQYLLQHILHLSVLLRETADPKQQQNLEKALLFYAKELHSLDAASRIPPFKQ